ncbi:MAG: nitroreductase family protein [Dehalococcoidia bacterium]|nr:nitroreductase family protein [Dehalococcoidia bacterium]
MSDFDTFAAIVKKRRSTRFFKPDPIPEDNVQKVIECGQWAMSGGNSQPWQFIVIKNGQTRHKIATLHAEVRTLTRPLELSRAAALQHPGSPEAMPSPFADAPVHIAVVGDPRTLVTSVVSASIITGEREVFHHGMANAAMVMHLAAASLGLNSEWVSVSPAWEDSLKRLLGVPEILKLPLLVVLGYAAKGPSAGFRHNLESIVHKEKYEMSKFRSTEAVLEGVTEIHRHRTEGRKSSK